MRLRAASRLAGVVALAWGGAACRAPTLPALAPPPAALADTLAPPPALAARLAGAPYRLLHHNGRGYAALRVPLDSGTAVVQWMDLRYVTIEHRLGEATPDTSAVPHPTGPSPFFASGSATAAVEAARAEGALAVVNGVFFKTVGAPRTQLSYPVAAGGRIVSGGTGAYDPARPDARRWGRALTALGFADTVAAVAPYEQATGAPLGAGAFADAFVSYGYLAHPARRATRYHVAGVLDASGDGTPETVVLVTSSGASTIHAPTRWLTALGVPPEAQTTLDGGGSVFVWNRRAGWLERTTNDRLLPHVLVVRERPAR